MLVFEFCGYQFLGRPTDSFHISGQTKTEFSLSYQITTKLTKFKELKRLKTQTNSYYWELSLVRVEICPFYANPLSFDRVYCTPLGELILTKNTKSFTSREN